jgi:integrase/recombinase XerC
VKTDTETAAIVVLPPAAPILRPRKGVKELLDAFLRGRNPNTLRAYAKDLDAFAQFLNAESENAAAAHLLSCDAGTANGLILDYRNDMVERKLAAATINRRLSSLRALVKLARMLGLVAWNIEIENLAVDPYRDTRGPGAEGVAAMLAKAQEREDAKGIRDVAIIRLLHDRGFRRGELVSLNREHYSPVRGLSLMGKGRRAREWISLPKPTRAALEAWVQVRGNFPGPLFVALDRTNAGHRLTGTAIYDIVRKLGDAVGVRARPHGLRHTAITSVLDKLNGNVRDAQKFSRHRDVRTLMIYDDARTDAGGAAAELVALGSDTKIMCARGHVYEAKWRGKFCVRGECKDGERGDPKRRIEPRSASAST